MRENTSNVIHVFDCVSKIQMSNGDVMPLFLLFNCGSYRFDSSVKRSGDELVMGQLFRRPEEQKGGPLTP